MGHPQQWLVSFVKGIYGLMIDRRAVIEVNNIYILFIRHSP